MANLTKVAKKDDLANGKGMAVSIDNKTIAVFQVDGKFYAIDDSCTHAGAPLSEGEVNGLKLTCPWHGAIFDLNSGAALEAPAFEGVKTYKVVVEGDDVFIEA